MKHNEWLWVLEQVAELKSTWNLAPVLQIVQIILKIVLANTHGVTDLVNHGMVENTKVWISWMKHNISTK